MKPVRLPAFTIMELIISMILTAIVMTLTFTAYHIVSSSYGVYQAKRMDMATLLRLDELLKKDVSHALVIRKEEGGFSLRDSTGLIIYHISQDDVLRSGAVTDTFQVKPAALTLSFAGAPAEQGRIDEIYFEVRYGEEYIPYHYYKPYSSENLINPTADAEN